MDLKNILSIKWGLSKLEFKNLFQNKIWAPDHPTQNAVGFFDEIDCEKASIVAYFIIDNYQDKLARIVVNFDDIKTDTQRLSLFKKQLLFLEKTYGRPHYTDTRTREVPIEFRLSELHAWKIKDTLITLTLALSKHGCQNPSVTISLGDLRNDPISKQFNWINNNMEYEIKNETESIELDTNKQRKYPKRTKYQKSNTKERDNTRRSIMSIILGFIVSQLAISIGENFAKEGYLIALILIIIGDILNIVVFIGVIALIAKFIKKKNKIYE